MRILYSILLCITLALPVFVCAQVNNSMPDMYTGIYNDFDMNETSLEIQKRQDGLYKIQIGIFRLVFLDDGIGKLKNGRLVFSTTAPNGKKLNGTITLDKDTAMVTFTSPGWREYSSINEYKYRKTSAVPKN